MNTVRSLDIPSVVGSTWGWLSASFQRRHDEIQRFSNLALKPKSKRRLFFLSFWDKKEKIHHILHLHQNDTGTIRLPRREGWLEGQRERGRERGGKREGERGRKGLRGRTEFEWIKVWISARAFSYIKKMCFPLFSFASTLFPQPWSNSLNRYCGARCVRVCVCVCVCGNIFPPSYCSGRKH